jgi:sugar phosphate isomerase/epimerase
MLSDMNRPNITFCLNVMTSYDEEAKVWVGYCPTLRLTTQARSEDRVAKAIKETIFSFVGLCWERNLLDEAMRERGMRRSTEKAEEIVEKAKAVGAEYIIVAPGKAAQDAWAEVPIALLASKRTMVECQH